MSIARSNIRQAHKSLIIIRKQPLKHDKTGMELSMLVIKYCEIKQDYKPIYDALIYCV